MYSGAPVLPFKKNQKVFEKSNQKYEWIDDENIHIHAKF
jgi:hypothetical protein